MKTEFGTKAETTMPLFELNADGISPIKSTSFSAERVAERVDLQRILRDQIEIVALNSMVLAEEFCDWEDSRRRIDLLCLDKDTDLDVSEPKSMTDLGKIFDETADADLSAGRRLVAAVIVRADTQVPSTGLFKFARKHGLMKGNDTLGFWAAELRPIQMAWSES